MPNVFYVYLLAWCLRHVATLSNATTTSATTGDYNDDTDNSDDSNEKLHKLKTSDIDKLISVFINEMTEIQKHQADDEFSYTRVILILLVVITLFSLKTKLYRFSRCCGKKPSKSETPLILESIRIQELNYNINKDRDVIE